MLFESPSANEKEVPGLLWRFADCEFNETSRELRRHGQPVELEAKPLEVLCQLLLHAGEVVTKEELLEAAWPGVRVVEGSLATAISKLRKALHDEDSHIILTVPRTGYRLGVPVQSASLPAPRIPELGFLPGDFVPGREQWQLLRRLDAAGSSQVWLAGHPKTGERRVFKFASDGIRLKALKREVTLARFLKESLGERPEFVKLLEWNFETAPFYLESEYCGANLEEWAEEQGGLEKVPLLTRVRLLSEIAAAVAAAHEVGVLHKDLKPANILIVPAHDGGWQVKVADFGSGSLLEASRLRELGITNLGFTQTGTHDPETLTGTLMYLGPEVLAGQAPTALADVYALGVILYQLVAGDFRKPLSPGWEAAVDDPLLREDIADAACGDPQRRLPSAAMLAQRLDQVDRRRVERAELARSRDQALQAERRLAQARARRPWVAASVAALAAGLITSFVLYHRASEERDRANRQTAVSAAINRFLASDVLGRSDPFAEGKAAETLPDAMKQAAAKIDRQFQTSPEVAAQLHQAMARAFDNRSDFPDARRQYERAAALFEQAQGPQSEGALVVKLQRASMEARSYEKGSLPLAKSILARLEPEIHSLPKPSGDLFVWLASARGTIALIDNDARKASEQFQLAFQRASELSGFDENARLILEQRLAFSYIRLGDGAKAEKLFRQLIADFTRLDGAGSPSVLRVRLNLAQAFMIEGKHREAIQETTAIYPLYVTRLGEGHELSMQVLTTRAESEGSLGLWDQAIRDDLAIYRLALRKQGPFSFFAIATLSDAALAQCRAGRYQEGAGNAHTAWEASTKAFGPRAGLTGGTAQTLATCWIALDRLPEAARLLETIDPQAVAQLSGDPNWSANLDLTRAELAFRRGDYPTARKYLQAAAPVFSRPNAEAYQRNELETLRAKMDPR
ncbi:MAG TPA: tetratricopeptide repeat protein [Bryobacteraceae bacterium]|jgi:DNA-binding winged helix-turn-helix (wHTH) protein/serine/threonine protein kinase